MSPPTHYDRVRAMGTRGIEDFLEGAMGEDTMGFDRDIEGIGILTGALE